MARQIDLIWTSSAGPEPRHADSTVQADLARRPRPAIVTLRNWPSKAEAPSLPTLGELIAMPVASAVAYRLSIKGVGGSLLVATGYRGAIGSASQLVRLSREALPRAVELPTDLVLPLTYAILGMLTPGPAVMSGDRRHPLRRSSGSPSNRPCHSEVVGQGTACRCGAGAHDATPQET